MHICERIGGQEFRDIVKVGVVIADADHDDRHVALVFCHDDQPDKAMSACFIDKSRITEI
jgi:hypothetical protein